MDERNRWGGATHGGSYLLVSGPMKGLVISCTVALEANIIPTLTFSLVSRVVASGQVEELGGGCVGGTSSADRLVALESTDLTVWSYKDKMVWKVAGGALWDSVLFFRTRSLDGSLDRSLDWSRLYR